MIDIFLDVGRNLEVLTALNRAKLRIALHLFAEANTTSAVNATRHIGRHQRANVFVLNDTFAIVVSRNIAAVSHRQILQFAFATLIANRAVERMIDQQEFHGRFLSGDSTR